MINSEKDKHSQQIMSPLMNADATFLIGQVN